MRLALPASPIDVAAAPGGDAREGNGARGIDARESVTGRLGRVAMRRRLTPVFFVCTLTFMRKRGRPPKPATEKRQERLDLRVSQAEKMAFKLAAVNSQQDLSVWIRIQLHRAASEELAEADTSESDPKGASNAKHG